MPSTHITFANRVSRVLLSESSQIMLLLAMCGVLLGLGFIFGDPNNNNYKAINEAGSAILWGISFTAYGLIKAIQTLYRIPTWLKFVASAAGIWAWNYVFLSFTLLDPTPVAPTEILLAIPIVCEMWGLAVSLFTLGQRKGRRSIDK